MISVCMIAKNEEEYLPACLDALAKTPWEIVFVDTGSSDRTKEIAGNYTNHIYDFSWVNDFSKARNFSLKQASHDMVLIVDCDEIAQEFDVSHIESLVKSHPNDIGRISRINTYTRDGNHFESKEQISRLFNRQYYHYSGRIHEQVTPEGSTYSLPLTFLHYGYNGDAETLQKKTNRNLNLLLQELEIAGKDPYILYQIGKSYYMQQNYTLACQYFAAGLEFDLDPALEYVQDMVETYGYSLINSKQPTLALAFENIYDAFAGSSDFVFLMGIIYMNNARFSQAIQEFTKATAFSNAKMKGVNSYLAHYNIGVIYECLGQPEQARHYYRLCGNYEKAIAGLKRL